MIHQLETRLVQSEAHFKATELFPARIDFTLSNKQILQRLALIFEPSSPYYDDVVQHGNIDSVHTDLENWIIRWRGKPQQDRPKKTLQCLNSVNIDLYPNIKVVLIHFLTLPVATCSVERAFSEMRLLKTCLKDQL